MRLAADRHLPLLHHLEQRGLHLRGCAVDLVGEQEVAQHRAELGIERAGVRAIDARADEIGGHEVGGELHPAEGPAEHLRGGLDRQRLGEPGDALQQQVAAGEQADEHPLQHGVLTCDNALDLEQRALEHIASMAVRDRAAYRTRAA